MKLEEEHRAASNMETLLSSEEAKQYTIALAVSQVGFNRALRHNHEMVIENQKLQYEVTTRQNDWMNNLQDGDALAKQLEVSHTQANSAALEHSNFELKQRIQDLERTISIEQATHHAAMDDLIYSKDQLLSTLRQAQSLASTSDAEITRLRKQYTEQLEETRAQLSGAEQALEELRNSHMTSSHELHKALEDAKESREQLDKRVAGDDAARRDLIAQQEQEISRLRDDIKLAQSSQHTAEVALQDLRDSFKSLKEKFDAITDQHKSDILTITDKNAASQQEMEGRLAELQTQLNDQSIKLDEARRESEFANQRLEEEIDAHHATNERHQKDLSGVQLELKDAENVLAQVQEETESNRAQLLQSTEQVNRLQREKLSLQEATTTLEAEVQKSMSARRYLESQVKESEEKIASFTAEIDEVRAELARSEKAANAAEVGLSLQGAQHKREMLELNRQLSSLRAQTHLQSALAELEQRNDEMEELLRKKCAEIEENDDRALDDGIFLDLSADLRDGDEWKVGTLRTLDYPQNLTAFAIESISGLLAVGTQGGAIYLFGRPGVETKLLIPDATAVKFIAFAPTSFQLVCLDDASVLHIWDLNVYGRPQLVKSTRFDASNSLTLSPYHSQAFITLNSGSVKTYDLQCLRKSHYSMPNMWKLYQDKLRTKRISYVAGAGISAPVDALAHPRDLNQLFVAYTDGVLLTDLTEQTTLGAYELILPPGAPGGYGYGSPNLSTHRRPEVTALTLHPAGHFFVVGYADGSLAFWAIDDEEKPLLVRTLDDLDVNLSASDEQMSSQHKKKPIPGQQREPIFKLSWSSFSTSSDPRGGRTTLAILGGLTSTDAPGLTVVQFPAFNPTEPPASTLPASEQPLLHPLMRQAMRDSLEVLDSFFYFTQATIQDYLLVPRSSPHFNSTFDPIAILLLTEGEGGSRTIEAYQYPPQALSCDDTKSPTPALKVKPDPLTLAEDLAETLKDLEETEGPRKLITPPSLYYGKSGILGGQLLKVERETYQALASGKEQADIFLSLNGGRAWADESTSKDLKLAKFQSHRVSMKWHRDLTITFDDMSAQLLDIQRPTPLQSDFPNPLSDLTIDLKDVLLDSVVSSRTSPTVLEHARVEWAHFTPETLEITIVLSSGEIVLYRLSGPRNPSVFREAQDRELVVLEHVRSHKGYSPYIMLAPMCGPVDACAMSGMGLLAAAYSNSLFIVNMRGPEVLLRYSDDKHPRERHIPSLISGHSDLGKVTSMAWCISQLAKGAESQVRLVVARSSGRYQIYTLMQSGSSQWRCEGPLTIDGGVSNALPHGIFIMSSKSGAPLSANHIHLAETSAGGPKVPSILVMVGETGAKTFADLNGQRIGKVEWGHKAGHILGSRVLVVATSKYDVLVYSLPHLELVMTLKLPPILTLSISFDETGDFISWRPHTPSGIIDQATCATLFDIRRTYALPDIDLACTKPVVPLPPQRVAAGPPSMLQQVGSWLPFAQSMTGAQLDELGASGVAAAAAATQTNLYNRLTSALSERGQVLGDLEERFNALGEESQNMLEETNERLGALSDTPDLLSQSMLRAIQRHREVFQDNVRELKRTKTSVKNALDQVNLLTGVRNDIDAYKSSAADALLAERGRIESSHHMTDDVLNQAYETRSEFARQRTSLSGINARMLGVLNSMPGINNVIGLIKSRRRRDSIILGVTIGVCIILILTYMWS
ncbi:hypothetical protein H0H93_011422 [Arthromyces matolae]|nr:hypothetical protein H0H93_011422 [Arthromyces matolae]